MLGLRWGPGGDHHFRVVGTGVDKNSGDILGRIEHAYQDIHTLRREPIQPLRKIYSDLKTLMSSGAEEADKFASFTSLFGTDKLERFNEKVKSKSPITMT